MRLLLLGLIVVTIVLAEEDGVSSETLTNESQSGAVDSMNTEDKGNETLKDVEERIKKIVQDASKLMLPYAMEAVTDLSISSPCMYSLLQFFRGVQSISDWAIRMIDASQKPPSGILKGTSTSLGDYDECLDVVYAKNNGKQVEFQGQYCLLEIRPSQAVMDAIIEYQYGANRSQSYLAKTDTFMKFLKDVRVNPKFIAFHLGFCVPSKCTTEDVQNMASYGSKLLEAPVHVQHCEIKHDVQLRIEQKIILGILGVVIFMVVVGTSVEFILRCRRSCDDNENCSVPSGKVFKIFMSFSIVSNIQKLIEPSDNDQTLGAVQGVRLFSVISAIYTNTYSLVNPMQIARYRDSLNVVQFSQNITFASVANPSAGVDSYFFLAGFLSVYSRWRLADKPRISTYIPRFLSQQYARMAGIQLVIIALFLLFPLIGSGPIWEDFVGGPLQSCRNLWWTNLLFIQNFWGVYDMCLYHTWFLATMMQLYILTAILLVLLHKWPTAGIFLTVLTIIGGAVATGVITVIKGYPPSLTSYLYDYRTAASLWVNLYVQLYNHIGPFCIGMLTAWILANCPKPKLPVPLVIFGWCCSIACILSIVYGLYKYRDGQPMDTDVAAFYAAAHRHGWALALAWVVFAGSRGYGGWIYSIMSWKALVPFDRLSYFAYLLHIVVIYYRGATLRELIFMGKFEQVMAFLGYLCISYVAAFILYIVFQVPYMFVESLICSSPVEPTPEDCTLTIRKETSIKKAPKDDKANRVEDWNKVRGVINNGFYI